MQSVVLNDDVLSVVYVQMIDTNKAVSWRPDNITAPVVELEWLHVEKDWVSE